MLIRVNRFETLTDPETGAKRLQITGLSNDGVHRIVVNEEERVRLSTADYMGFIIGGPINVRDEAIVSDELI